jgi:hypothetical protein
MSDFELDLDLKNELCSEFNVDVVMLKKQLHLAALQRGVALEWSDTKMLLLRIVLT